MITLTTDLDDIYIAQMTGAILSIHPDATVVEIFHDVQRFNVRRASYAMMCAARAFSGNAVHVCVVDPGVGSSRRGIVVDAGRAKYVGPDNGAVTLPLGLHDRAEAYMIDHARVSSRTGRAVSRTFHGRDIFAPVAALLDLGEDPAHFGDRMDEVVTFDVQPPVVRGAAALGTVLFVDGFGNIVTNIPESALSGGTGSAHCVKVGGKTFPCTKVACYADAEKGQLICLVGSQGTYEISLNQASAASIIGASEGDVLEIAPED